MASISETGHAKNVANFKQLITVLDSFGGRYQPIADALQIATLEKQAQEADIVLNKLKDSETLSKQATAILQAEFKTLNTLSSQLMGLLISSGAKASSVEEARAIQKVITGSNSKKKKVFSTEVNTSETKDTRSTSRQSYDSKLDNFEKLIVVLQNVTEYKPKENEFQVSTLQAKVNAMKNAIKDSDGKEIARRQVMNERNTLLYTAETGIVATANKVKAYIKAVFGGVKSAEYKEIVKINFSNVKS